MSFTASLGCPNRAVSQMQIPGSYGAEAADNFAAVTHRQMATKQTPPFAERRLPHQPAAVVQLLANLLAHEEEASNQVVADDAAMANCLLAMGTGKARAYSPGNAYDGCVSSTDGMKTDGSLGGFPWCSASSASSTWGVDPLMGGPFAQADEFGHSAAPPTTVQELLEQLINAGPAPPSLGTELPCAALSDLPKERLADPKQADASCLQDTMVSFAKRLSDLEDENRQLREQLLHRRGGSRASGPSCSSQDAGELLSTLRASTGPAPDASQVPNRTLQPLQSFHAPSTTTAYYYYYY
eukprot:GHVT01048220.1.p1 GENE.GHVT01048220.1~~GHVT01048220.1.p1  ORF type:complete len:297 (-),score=67.69 GHVT01048220.1:4289-5179(-)